jgi:hypothetical protein
VVSRGWIPDEELWFIWIHYTYERGTTYDVSKRLGNTLICLYHNTLLQLESKPRDFNIACTALQ